MSASLRDLGRRVDALPTTHFDAADLMRQGEARLRRHRLAAAAGAAVAVAMVVGTALLTVPDTRDAAPPPAAPNHVDTWVTTDVDGSTETMVVRKSGDDPYEIVVRDDSASVCSRAPSTMTGTGRLDGARELVIPSPVLTCDDESEPKVESGPPLEEVLRNLTFVHDPEADTLTDSFGLVWDRGETTGASGGMWPQSSLEEAQEAQRLADAGDPRFTWQVWPDIFPRQGQMDPRAVEFFTRFLQEELGWEEFSWSVAPGLNAGVLNDWPWEFVVVRCAPGRMNPLYTKDPEGRGCAPTIDEHRYETLRINADQPARHWEAPNGPSGIWVVTRGAMLQPITDTNGLLRIAAPAFQRQVQQVVPPSDAEATAFMRAFLQVRVDGEGAEEYLHAPAGAQNPLLYATTSDAPYERSEFELVQGPVWPGGWMEFKVRLFADGGSTVVEQPLVVDRGEDGRLVLVYGTLEDEDFPTTENGEALAEPFEFLDGEVTFAAAPPWDYGVAGWDGPTMHTVGYGGDDDERVAVVAHPQPVETGCQAGRAPSDAEALARSIRSDPDFEATAPVAVTVGGNDALRMDVTAAPGASVCEAYPAPLVLTPNDHHPSGVVLKQGERMRLYLLDAPEGSSTRILAIAIAAPEDRFETVLDATAPIVDSFEFHAP